MAWAKLQQSIWQRFAQRLYWVQEEPTEFEKLIKEIQDNGGKLLPSPKVGTKPGNVLQEVPVAYKVESN